MKNLVATAALLLAFASTAVFAQNSAITTSPVEGAQYLGSYEVDLASISTPMPELTAAVDQDRSAIESSIWATVGGDVIITMDSEAVMDWASNDVVFHTATDKYVLNKVGKLARKTAKDLGLIYSSNVTVLLVEPNDTEVTAVIAADDQD